MSKMRYFGNKKESIKATISGLALMLAIGGIGGIGSYAYFTDQSNVDNSLRVTMGSFDIGIGAGINENNAAPGQTISKDFIISNEGTLDQYVDALITIERPTTFTPEDLGKITYTLSDSNKELITGTFSNEANLKCDDLRINGKESITLTAVVNIPNEVVRGKSQKKLNFKLNVEGRQINAPEEGGVK